MTDKQIQIQKLGNHYSDQIQNKHLADCQNLARVAIIHALDEQPDNAYTAAARWEEKDVRERATLSAIFYDEQRNQTVQLLHPNGLYCRVIGYTPDGVLTAYDDPSGEYGLDGVAVKWDETIVLPLKDINSCEALLLMVEHLTDDFPYRLITPEPELHF
jgi:hypothetical protein